MDNLGGAQFQSGLDHGASAGCCSSCFHPVAKVVPAVWSVHARQDVHVFQEPPGSRSIVPAPPTFPGYSRCSHPAQFLPMFGSITGFFRRTEGIVLAEVNTRNSQRGFQHPRNNHAIPHKWGETRWNLLGFFPLFLRPNYHAGAKI